MSNHNQFIKLSLKFLRMTKNTTTWENLVQDQILKLWDKFQKKIPPLNEINSDFKIFLLNYIEIKYKLEYIKLMEFYNQMNIYQHMKLGCLVVYPLNYIILYLILIRNYISLEKNNKSIKSVSIIRLWFGLF